MCLCNGTGSVAVTNSWGIQFHACPDSSCEFDRHAAEKRYEEWKKRMYYQMEKEIGFIENQMDIFDILGG